VHCLNHGSTRPIAEQWDTILQQRIMLDVGNRSEKLCAVRKTTCGQKALCVRKHIFRWHYEHKTQITQSISKSSLKKRERLYHNQPPDSVLNKIDTEGITIITRHYVTGHMLTKAKIRELTRKILGDIW
jgi:hypothetical protein